MRNLWEDRFNEMTTDVGRSLDIVTAPRWSEPLAHHRPTPVYLQPSRMKFADIYMRGNHKKKFAI